MSERHLPAVDVAVIGAGAVGLAVAWQASRRGLRVAVLEREEAGAGTTRHAAGMLAPVAEAMAAEEPLLELGLQSLRRYPEFLRELGGDAGFLGTGTLLVARDSDEAEALDRELELRRRLGLEVERLRPSQARRLEPGLSPALRLALSVPQDVALDPRRLRTALVDALRRDGGELHEHTPATGLITSGGRVAGVRCGEGGQLTAAAVVVAAGVWSDQIDGLDGVRLRPVKGQIMRLHDPAGPGMLTRVIRTGGAYIVPRGDGRYVIGATSEERGFDTTVTAGAAFDLLRDAAELVPGITELVLDEFTAGLRPGTADNRPVIGPDARPGLHWATGHGRSGILLAPVTADIVCSGLLGEAPDPLSASFSPDRVGVGTVGSAA